MDSNSLKETIFQVLSWFVICILVLIVSVLVAYLDLHFKQKSLNIEKTVQQKEYLEQYFKNNASDSLKIDYFTKFK